MSRGFVTGAIFAFGLVSGLLLAVAIQALI